METIFTEYTHYNVMGSVGIYPYRSLIMIISPGLLLVGHHEEYETRYSTHIGVVHGFMIGEFEIEPVAGSC